MSARIRTAVERRSRWIPWSFVGFFAVVLAANGIMIAFALSSWTGLDAKDAYRRGVQYNQALEAAARQAELGWRSRIAFNDAGGRAGRLEFELADRTGAPLRHADVRAAIVRPTTAGHDFATRLEESAPGRYAAIVAFPLAGQWEVRVLAEVADVRHAAVARVMVTP